MKKIEVSFITINYNSSQYTAELINSILSNTDSVSYEIIVVDNASEDKDFLRLKEFLKDKNDVTLIRNSINSGFSSGNMLGVNHASGQYYFFVNNDCKLLNNTAGVLKEYLDSNAAVALATAQIVDANNNYSSSHKQFPHLLKQLFGNSVQRKFSRIKFPSNRVTLDKPTQVEVVSGSCMFFNADAFCDIGGFDTAFFLYCEEEDIAKRIWESDRKVFFIPEAQIFHEAGGSTEQGFRMQQEFYISYYHLLNKHYNRTGRVLLKIALFFKLFFRMFKKKMGVRMFLSMLSGFPQKNSLRYSQKIKKHHEEVV
ncbi:MULTISPECIES: glycosyltransferase family 2 protein [Halomonas]|uniref:glycosyltransferase family 2 protein n=1 Tax=Halomonas TaxID=2745 RepID=UPI001867B141|nr:glycosyltransferase family 2 protein [Halomonas citrativorans]